MAVTKRFRVYGYFDGEIYHRQRESFAPSLYNDFSNEETGTRLLNILNYDVTGTHKYSILEITRDTEKEVYEELDGQISDGFFENSQIGAVVEEGDPDKNC